MNKIHEFVDKHPVISRVIIGGTVLSALTYGAIELSQQDSNILEEDRVAAVKTIDHVDLKDTFVLPSGTKVLFSPTGLRGNARNEMAEVPGKQTWVVTNAYTSKNNPGCIAFNVPGENLGKEQKTIEDVAKKIGWVCDIAPSATDPTNKNVGAMINSDGSIALGLPAEAWKDFLGTGRVDIKKA